MTDKLQDAGWEFVEADKSHGLTVLTFRREENRQRWGFLTPRAWLAVALSVALLTVLAVVVINNGSQWKIRYDAWDTAEALKSGNLDSVEDRLARYRGDVDFAYYFAS